jgi:hypothetical protein
MIEVVGLGQYVRMCTYCSEHGLPYTVKVEKQMCGT